MMRHIDHLVAFNAVPVHAKAQSAEQVSLLYKQIQSYAEAKNENLIRPERVAEAAGRSGLVFERGEMLEILKKEKTEKKSVKLYGPEENRKSKKNYLFEETGTVFNAIA